MSLLNSNWYWLFSQKSYTTAPSFLTLSSLCGLRSSSLWCCLCVCEWEHRMRDHPSSWRTCQWSWPPGSPPPPSCTTPPGPPPPSCFVSSGCGERPERPERPFSPPPPSLDLSQADTDWTLRPAWGLPSSHQPLPWFPPIIQQNITCLGVITFLQKLIL